MPLAAHLKTRSVLLNIRTAKTVARTLWRNAHASTCLTAFGLFCYAAFAPHSIAGAEIALAFVFAGWLWRKIAERGLRIADSRNAPRNPQSAIEWSAWLLIGWTVISAALSYEPAISLRKLQSLLVFGAFYLAWATLRRAWVAPFIFILLLSGAVGAMWSAIDLVRGRGVVIETMAADSPYRQTLLQPGDAVWRVGGRRVSSIAEIDDILRRAPVGSRVSLSAIAKGEHAEWPLGVIVTEEMQLSASPSGLSGTQPTHRFRASGWTRHYQTFAEILQMLAQIALGITLTLWARGQQKINHEITRNGTKQAANFVPFRAVSRFILLYGTLTLILVVGIALTAMRTALVAFGVGALVVAWRAARGRWARIGVILLVSIVLGLGAWTVARTRAGGALRLGDDSSNLRLQLANAALARIAVHPIFGHGLDAMKTHWHEWGFPGDIIIHTHSTPLQIAFERGLPALFLWLWLMVAAWRTTARAERQARNAMERGILLGILGALTGFAASSLVNYNWGDAEVIILFWWLLGIIAGSRQPAAGSN